MTIPAARSTTYVDVDEKALEPKFHCEHDDGTITVEVAHYPVTVYLNGTPAQLMDWADKVATVAVEVTNQRWEHRQRNPQLELAD